MDIKTVEAEIEALVKQGQEAIQAVHKIEGALQFAHHVLAGLKANEQAKLSVPKEAEATVKSLPKKVK